MKAEGSMRVRVVGMVLGVVAVGAFGTSHAVAGSAGETHRLPRVVIGSYSGIKPKVVAFSGDGGNIVGRLKWRWTRASATGHGTSDIQGCVPNCAQGTETPVKTTVTFSRPRHGRFTKVVEVRNGQRLVGYYGRDSWPEGAQS
jgi:hypothetical protein